MSNNRIMTDAELNVKIANEKEWRKLMWRKLEGIETLVHGNAVANATLKTEMKIRFSLIGVVFGSISGMVTGIIGTIVTLSFR